MKYVHLRKIRLLKIIEFVLKILNSKIRNLEKSHIQTIFKTYFYNKNIMIN
jgi:hypothetical protein